MHWNVAPVSELNPNDGEVPFVAPDGPEVIVVSGAVVSTVIVRVLETLETLPAPSVALAV